MQTIEKSELVRRIEGGEFLAVGEYRMSKAEMLNWRDKQTGVAKSAPMLRHVVEFGSRSVTVSERVPDSTKIEDIHVAFNKGDTVVLEVEEFISARGLVTCRGRLFRLGGNGAPQPGRTVPVGRGASPGQP